MILHHPVPPRIRRSQEASADKKYAAFAETPIFVKATPGKPALPGKLGVLGVSFRSAS
jgi:hypothetical protein